jgi:hypothetical protein
LSGSVSTTLLDADPQEVVDPLATPSDEAEGYPNESDYLDEWEKNISSWPKEPVKSENKMVIPALIAVLVILSFLSLFLFSYYNKKRDHSCLIKQCEESLKRIDSLKVLRGSIMHGYHTRAISEEEARNAVLDCEKDLVFETEKLRRLLRKLGIRRDLLMGKEEIIGWIMQKLSLGEEPEILRKGLIGMGADPALVDVVKNAVKA